MHAVLHAGRKRRLPEIGPGTIGSRGVWRILGRAFAGRLSAETLTGGREFPRRGPRSPGAWFRLRPCEDGEVRVIIYIETGSLLTQNMTEVKG